MIAKLMSVHNGFIFVSAAGYDNNVFVHASAFPAGYRRLGNLPQGADIEIDHIMIDERGPRANWARVVGFDYLEAPTPVPEQTSDLVGHIVRLRPDRGYGFIRVEPQGEYYFNCSACTDVRFEDLHEGDAVVFDVVPTDREGQPRAVNLSLARVP